MKLTSLIGKSLVGVACMSFVLGTAARAGERSSSSSQQVKRVTASEPVLLVTVTGSRIPQRVYAYYGQQVNSGSPVYVVQGSDLIRRGGVDVPSLLSGDPSISVRHQ